MSVTQLKTFRQAKGRNSKHLLQSGKVIKFNTFSELFIVSSRFPNFVRNAFPGLCLQGRTSNTELHKSKYIFWLFLSPQDLGYWERPCISQTQAERLLGKFISGTQHTFVYVWLIYTISWSSTPHISNHTTFTTKVICWSYMHINYGHFTLRPKYVWASVSVREDP